MSQFEFDYSLPRRMLSMLRYKAERAGGWFAVIDATNTSQSNARTVQKDLSVRIQKMRALQDAGPPRRANTGLAAGVAPETSGRSSPPNSGKDFELRHYQIAAGSGVAYIRPMSNLRPDAPEGPLAEAIADCPRCQKPVSLCVCNDVTPIKNRIALLILQHPQEQDRALGTARLAAQHFANAVVRIGLSWPSLSKALGRQVSDASRWAVLYLGSAKAAARDPESDLVAITRKGEVADNQRAILGRMEGVVLLDGTWSQAKALWWRNPWMLKCQRVILGPHQPSRYGRLRKEPRRDGLSTIEAAGMLVARLEKRPDIETALNTSFERMLARYREVQATMPERVPRPKPRGLRNFRRKRTSLSRRP